MITICFVTQKDAVDHVTELLLAELERLRSKQVDVSQKADETPNEVIQHASIYANNLLQGPSDSSTVCTTQATSSVDAGCTNLLPAVILGSYSEFILFISILLS
jgi:hypothetical protein